MLLQKNENSTADCRGKKESWSRDWLGRAPYLLINVLAVTQPAVCSHCSTNRRSPSFQRQVLL